MHGFKKLVVHQWKESCEFVRGAWLFTLQVLCTCVPKALCFFWKPILSSDYVHGAWAFGFQVSHMCLPVGVGLFWKPKLFILKSA